MLTSTLLLLVAGLFATGQAVMALAVRRAPEGFEGARGFEIIWRNNNPGVEDVTCIWARLSETSALPETDSFQRFA